MEPNATPGRDARFNDPELIKRYKRLIGPTLFASYVGFFVLLAWAASLVSNIGDDVRPSFYELLAQILVTLLLATVIEEATSSARPLKQFAELGGPAFIRASKWWEANMRAKVGIFALGEACCLYAVAAGASSPFLTVAPCLAGVVATMSLLAGLSRRAGIADYPLLAGMHRQLAAALAEQAAADVERAAGSDDKPGS